MLFKRVSFYLSIAGIIGTILLVRHLNQQPPAPPPDRDPARSPYADSVAATGIIEAVRENVKVAAPKPGLVKKVHVQVGDKVRSGDPLMLLDDRDTRAQVAAMQAQVDAMKAALDNEKVLRDDAEDQFTRADKLEKQNVASVDERIRKKFSFEAAKTMVAKMEADLKSADAQLEQSMTNLEILTVRAPRDGTILQLNIREGEYAGTTPTDPLMILGDTKELQIRADVDEQNAPLVEAGSSAVAFLKGDTTRPIQIRFVRIEPFVVPKKNLTGDSSERVDTRVLQIIFQFDHPAFPVYVGQQMDVFIQRGGTNFAQTAKVN
jgi:RND family efflux transporter MFP subunit